eukprot:TRINITY_DN2745_c2_g1_i3.p1 TRINITY_DN2745_c2_g1~~TRINITY_DN2745_c2_g1_i3.p1  ORF type:complete len:309 (+),score=-35.54 TRINITY_DN2745_c2_g1_i3:130-927(+)
MKCKMLDVKYQQFLAQYLLLQKCQKMQDLLKTIQFISVFSLQQIHKQQNRQIIIRSPFEEILQQIFYIYKPYIKKNMILYKRYFNLLENWYFTFLALFCMILQCQKQLAFRILHFAPRISRQVTMRRLTNSSTLQQPHKQQSSFTKNHTYQFICTVTQMYILGTHTQYQYIRKYTQQHIQYIQYIYTKPLFHPFYNFLLYIQPTPNTLQSTFTATKISSPQNQTSTRQILNATIPKSFLNYVRITNYTKVYNIIQYHRLQHRYLI